MLNHFSNNTKSNFIKIKFTLILKFIENSCKKFIKSYQDNSHLETYEAKPVDWVDNTTIGQREIQIEVSDLSGNFTVGTVKLTVVPKL